MFGGFGTKFSLIARKIVAQAAQQLSAWPVWFSGIATSSNTSVSGYYTRNACFGKRSPILGGTGQSWASLAPGTNQNLGIKSDGTLWAWGVGLGSGEMGHSANVAPSPLQVGADTDWKDVARASQRSIALKQNGTLWAWGLLPGINSTNSSSPIQIGTDTWSFITAGGNNRFAIKSNGTLWTWGSNISSSAGLPYSRCEFPIKIGTNSDWSKLSFAYRTSMAIKTDGTLWSWGNNYQYTGGGPTAASSVPNQVGSTNTWSEVSITTNHGLAIRSDGTLWAWGRNNYGQLGLNDVTTRSSPVQIGTDSDWAFLNTSTGVVRFNASFAIKTTGTLWAWGINSSGQLGLGNTVNRSSPVQVGTGATGDWSKVVSNGRTTFALKTNGTLWSWGSNNYGMLGHNNTTSRSSPVQVGTGTTGDWSNVFVDTLQTTFATKTNGTLWAWGRNNVGQLGLGNTTNRSSPTQVGSATDWKGARPSYIATLAYKNNGQIWFSGKKYSWITGYTHYGSLFAFFGTNQNTMTAAANLAGHTGWSSLYSAGSATDLMIIGKKSNNEIWTWGSRFPGGFPISGLTGWYSSGNPLSVPTQVGTDTNWKSIATSAGHHTMATKTDGTLWAWGNNYSSSVQGWLGFPTTNRQISSPVQVGTDNNWKSVIATVRATIATKTDGTLWAWGRNNYGQLGLGNTVNQSSPVQVGTGTDWNSPFKNSDITTIAVVKTDGTAWGFGRNSDGVLGLTAAWNNDFAQIGNDANWTSEISTSRYGIGHVLAAKSDGTLWSWGKNLQGQLGHTANVGSNTPTSSPIQVGTDTNWSKVRFNDGDWSSAVRTDNTLWTWGGGASGKLGHGNLTSRSSPVQVGALTDWSRSCGTKGSILAIKTDGTLWAWGSNSDGELGLGNTTWRSSPVQVGTLTDWQSVSICNVNSNQDGQGYGGFAMAIKTNGSLWAWGNNNYGQLGLGNTSGITSPVRVGTDTNWKSVRAHVFVNRRGATLAIKTDGTLWAWGQNYQFFFGDPLIVSSLNRSSPVQVGTDTDWDDFLGVSLNNGSFTLKKTNGTLWTWGSLVGKLPYCFGIRSSKPVQLFGGNTGWTNTLGAANVGLAVKSDGTLWHVGSNVGGLHGGAVIPSTTIGSISSPVQLGSDSDWRVGSAMAGAEGAGSSWIVALKGSS